MRFLTILLGALAAATPAFAHTGTGTESGIVHGFLHPLAGLDHVLAMIAIGVLASQLGGRALWLIPCAFLSCMVAGGLIGVAGVAVPMTEIAIALSVVVIGALVALDRHLSLVLAMGIAGGIAIFHGHAHGVEMPALAFGLTYGLGFLIATALLHGCGLLIGLASRRGDFARAARIGGGATAAAGVLLLVSRL